MICDDLFYVCVFVVWLDVRYRLSVRYLPGVV